MKAGCKNDCDCFIQHDSGVFSENSDITKPETRITKRIGNPDAVFPGKENFENIPDTEIFKGAICNPESSVTDRNRPTEKSGSPSHPGSGGLPKFRKEKRDADFNTEPHHPII